jgi:hypothetical protein
MEMPQETYALTADQLGLRLDAVQPATALQEETVSFSSRPESISEEGFEDRIVYALLPSPRDFFDQDGQPQELDQGVELEEDAFDEEEAVEPEEGYTDQDILDMAGGSVTESLTVEDTQETAGAASSSDKQEITVGGDKGAQPSWHHAEGGLIGQKKLRRPKALGSPKPGDRSSKGRDQGARVVQRRGSPQPRKQPASPVKTGRPPSSNSPIVTHGANHPKSLDPPKRHEPAKVRCCADGRAMLRGVHSTSDFEKYASEVPLLSRSGANTRIAFKAMRANQQAQIQNSTWTAFHSLKASEQSFDQWFASAKQGQSYGSK